MSSPPGAAAPSVRAWGASRARRSRGLTLIECAVSLVIVAIGVTLVLQTDVGTTETAQHASNHQLAALLANEIMAYEAMTELPDPEEYSSDEYRAQPDPYAEPAAGPRQPVDPNDERFVDPDTNEFPYRDFEYAVTKRIMPVRAGEELSGTYGETGGIGDPIEEVEEGEEPREVLVVHIRVAVYFPAPESRGGTSAGGSGRPMGEVAVETYVFDPVYRDEMWGVAREEGE